MARSHYRCMQPACRLHLTVMQAAYRRSTVVCSLHTVVEADHVEPGSVPSSLTRNRPTLTSTRRGFAHKIVPNGVQLWRRLCSPLMMMMMIPSYAGCKRPYAACITVVNAACMQPTYIRVQPTYDGMQHAYDSTQHAYGRMQGINAGTQVAHCLNSPFPILKSFGCHGL